jgi:exopolysaccharide biosynthesis protein
MIVLLSFGGTQLARGNDWKLIDSYNGKGKPALVRKIVVNSAGKKVTLNLCSFSTNDFTIKVVDQGANQDARKFTNLRDAMEKSGCVAGVNGGFYGTDFKALGAVYENGKRIAPYVDSSRNGLASGVIWSGTGGIHIVRREEFKSSAGVKQAIQTGPMLVSRGAVVNGLSDKNWRSRSFVLTDWRGNWMVGTSTSVSLAALSQILNSRAVFKEFKINRAINLDGGRSTGFYLKQENGDVVYNQEFSRVRNFLGVVPK